MFLVRADVVADIRVLGEPFQYSSPAYTWPNGGLYRNGNSVLRVQDWTGVCSSSGDPRHLSRAPLLSAGILLDW